MNDGDWTFQTVWTRNDFNSEHLIDVQRLGASNTLSAIIRTDKNTGRKKQVVVMAFIWEG
jgi:hypothetical protein